MRIAQMLARAGLALSASTVKRDEGRGRDSPKRSELEPLRLVVSHVEGRLHLPRHRAEARAPLESSRFANCRARSSVKARLCSWPQARATGVKMAGSFQLRRQLSNAHGDDVPLCIDVLGHHRPGHA